MIMNILSFRQHFVDATKAIGANASFIETTLMKIEYNY